MISQSNHKGRSSQLKSSSSHRRSLRNLRQPSVRSMNGKLRRSELLRIVFVVSVFWITFMNFTAMKRNSVTSSSRQVLTVGDAPWMTENLTRTNAEKLPKAPSPYGPKKSPQTAFESSDFDWSDVDLSQKGNCGWHKCFWRSVSNQTIGYLVAEEKQFQQMQESVDVALELERTYNSKHFHLDLIVVNVTKAFKDHLNELVDQPARRARGLENQGIYKTNQLIIEKVVIAPDPGFFFGSTKANRKLTTNQLATFRKVIPDKKAFHNQLRAELERLQRVLKDKPSLALDFQAVIDPAGKLYHIDLDGHLSMAKRENNTELRVMECLDFLDEINERLVGNWTAKKAVRS